MRKSLMVNQSMVWPDDGDGADDASAIRGGSQPRRHPTEAEWRKSHFSDDQGGSCVEILVNGIPGGEVCVRDSKNREHAPLSFPRTEWSVFLAALKRAG
ncbi:hypothetical protein GCM10027570_40430 [Streptomonospora sediminis]